jgi:hypothetical protein
MFKTITALGAGGHQALAALIIIIYGTISCVSIMRHSERSHCRHLSLKATSLLREAAKSSLKADKKNASKSDRFVDAVRAKVYVSAVDTILTPQDVSRFAGISIDELRSYTNRQVDEAYVDLNTEQKADSVIQQQQTATLDKPVSLFALPTQKLAW